MKFLPALAVTALAVTCVASLGTVANKLYTSSGEKQPETQDAPPVVLTESQLKARAERSAVSKALVTCEVIVRNSLKNPSSYKRISNRWELEESERLLYRATNSFGAVVRDSFDCSPFVTASLKELAAAS